MGVFGTGPDVIVAVIRAGWAYGGLAVRRAASFALKLPHRSVSQRSSGALRPLRRKNLAGLIIGVTLRRAGTGWLICFPPADTKNKDAIEATWPAALLPALETYIAVHRPLLAVLKNRWAGPLGDALWVSSHGSPLTQMALYDVIRDRTQAVFGTGVGSDQRYGGPAG
jgi:hypothetical protein